MKRDATNLKESKESYMSKFGGRKERGDDVIILISKTKENFKNPQKTLVMRTIGLYISSL